MAYSRSRPTYPSQEDVATAKDLLKPPGILSKAYNKFQLKKVEREYENSSKPLSRESLQKRYQTDRLTISETPQKMDYFRVKTKHHLPSTYDRINNMDPNYDPKLHRDDRRHAKLRGLHVNHEEAVLPVPNCSSSIYGHPNRSQTDFPLRTHCHMEVCQKDFFRLTGTNIGQEEKFP